MQTVQIISASNEQLEQTGSPTIFKPFGATTKASPGHVEKNSETAVDASANTSMQYVAVSQNKRNYALRKGEHLV